MLKLKLKKKKNVFIFGDFKTPNSLIDRASRKNSKDIRKSEHCRSI